MRGFFCLSLLEIQLKNYVGILKGKINSLGGLDLSRHSLDRDSRSRQFEKVDLDMMDNLDTLKKVGLDTKDVLDSSKTKSQQSRLL